MEIRPGAVTAVKGHIRICLSHTISVERCNSELNSVFLEEYRIIGERYAKVRLRNEACYTIWPSLGMGLRTIAIYRFYCFGPSKSPMEMSANDASDWHGFRTPVIFNHHAPLEINSSNIRHIDLNPIVSTSKAMANQERVLIVTPLSDASPYLNKYFELLAQLTYPHDLIDIAFLVGDSSDDTMAVLATELDRLQKRPDAIPFRSATVIEKDFGFTHVQDVEERHKLAHQGPRRKAIARARNYLLYSALKPDHAWVYWRDVDIVDSPRPIIQDMIAHDRDVIVPSRDSLLFS